MRLVAGALSALALSTAAAPARATTPEPWSDDVTTFPTRIAIGTDTGVRAAAEYRATGTLVRSLANDQNLGVAEHRLRLDATLDWQERVSLSTSVDVLDGAIWGKDARAGTFTSPVADANATCLVSDAGDASAPTSYALASCANDPLFVRRLYGEVRLPVGVLRIGRQAYDDGNGVLVADGDGRRNRFGIAHRGDVVDRVMFVTKPIDLATDDGDPSEDRGVFLHLAYDRVAGRNVQRLGDDAHEIVTAVRALAPSLGRVRDVEARVFHAYRWQRSPDLDLHALGGRLSYRIGELHLGVDGAAIVGGTREGEDAIAAVSRLQATSKRDVNQFGVRSVASYRHSIFGMYLEVDYASGEATPAPSSASSRFSFATDSNVGLLLFERVLAYQSARAAAADAALLRSLRADGAVASEIATRGAFTNAFALFPQLDLRPHENVLVRVGALFAWAASPVVDPLRSRDRRARGVASPDVNLAGGAPARAYGTELDARISWQVFGHFALDLEGALLLPGAALADETGRAPHAALAQGRGTFFF